MILHPISQMYQILFLTVFVIVSLCQAVRMLHQLLNFLIFLILIFKASFFIIFIVFQFLQYFYNKIQVKSEKYQTMSWRFKNKINQADDEDEKYINEDNNSHQPEQQQQKQKQQQQNDPLDAFMNDLQENQESIKSKTMNKKQNKNQQVAENEEQQISNLQQLDYQEQQNQNQIIQDQIQHGFEYNINEQGKKIIQTLKPFDFSTVNLQKFQKNFYKQHQQITNMPNQVYNKLMKEHEIKIIGQNAPKLIVSFGHLPLTQKMKKVISQQGYEHPTPIQAQALPCALSGRDVVGIAKTGSGKTLAFVWPMIIHVNNRPQAGKGDGPTALILAPTRQLCQQIYVQAKKYIKKQYIKIDCLLGGENKHQQWKSLKAGTDILIASPGRLIQFIKKKATNLVRVTYLVLDQADRMLSLGFQQQIRSIISQTRQDRQTLLFTATMKKNMQVLVSDIVKNPLKIIIGDQSAANQDIKQQVIIIKQEQQKIHWLQNHIKQLTKQGKILLFANQRSECQNLGAFIQQISQINALVLHGDKNQYQRTTIMNKFKADGQILVATQIAARGIDVKNIKTVINYQCPKTIQAYIHRIGRAGRAGEEGTAYTFLMPNNVKFAIQLVGIFQNSGYPVSNQLEDLAMLDDVYRRKRVTSKMGISFAKGKDATKYLNNALKRQRKGYSRAGLGYEETKGNNNKKSEIAPTENTLFNQQQAQKMKNASIGEISLMIRNKMSAKNIQNKFGRQFIKSQQEQANKKVYQPTVSYYKKKQQ